MRGRVALECVRVLSRVWRVACSSESTGDKKKTEEKDFKLDFLFRSSSTCIYLIRHPWLCETIYLHPPSPDSSRMKSIVSFRKGNGRWMARCPKCGAEQRSCNIDRHLSICREYPSDAPIRLGKRRSRCPKCKKEMHSNKIRDHIAKCKVVPKPRPHCIDIRGDHEAQKM